VSRKFWIAGYILIFIGVYTLDQASKLQTQKNFMAYSDPQNSQIYENTSHYVFGLGNSPTKIRKNKISEFKAEQLNSVQQNEVGTKNWLDFELTYVRNHGAVWGIFSTLSENIRLSLFYSVTFFAVIAVFFMFWKSTPEQRIYRTALAFILAGAIGNFTDRFLLKYVIDWIHFQWSIFGWEYSFPVFNVADISIDVGIGLMIVDALLQGTNKKEVENSGQTHPKNLSLNQS
jgi:signal peptidase II